MTVQADFCLEADDLLSAYAVAQKLHPQAEIVGVKEEAVLDEPATPWLADHITPYVKRVYERRTKDAPAGFCECGNPTRPNFRSNPGYGKACQECIDIDTRMGVHYGETLVPMGRRPLEPIRRRHFGRTSGKAPAQVPQLDSRTIQSGLADIIRGLNRLQPYTQL